MNIKNLVIHHVTKQVQFDGVGVQQASKVNLDLAPNEHPLDDIENISKLAEMLEERVRSAGKGSSKLRDASQDTGSTGHINKYLGGEISFMKLSVSIAEAFSNNMPATSTSGYLTFVNYEIGDTQMIFICVLKLEDGVTIDRETLTVKDVTSIQKSNIHEGLRINTNKLTLHKEDTDLKENYIDWIKTKQSEKLSDFFQKIFDIDTAIDNTHQTTIFRKAADKYIEETVSLHEDSISDENFSSEQVASEMRQKVYEMVNERAKISAPLDFDDVNKLFELAWSDYGIELTQTFTEFASDSYNDLTNFFKPSSSLTKKWGTITHTIKSSENSIKFTVDRALLNDKEYFDKDEANKTVTFKQVGDDFFKQIN